MPTRTKHIFPDLRPEEDPSPEDLLRGSSLKETKGVILKRMILEVLPYLENWTKSRMAADPMSIQTIQQVKENKSLYSNVAEIAWNTLLENIIELTPEVHIWKTPPETTIWLADPKQNPFARRAKELVEAEDEETILVGWNQYCGVIACEILQGDKPLEERNPLFPKTRTKVVCSLYAPGEERKNSTYPNTKIQIWAWDKRNFEHKY